jgi:membrane fusion protein (multidrug efflux system)
MRTRWVGWLALGVCVALCFAGLAGCGKKEEAKAQATPSAKADTSKADTSKAKQAGGPAKKPEEGVPVKVEPVQTGMISSYLLYSSTVESEESVDVYPQVAGLVKEVRVEEGQFVSAGDTLIRLEDDEARLAVADAEVRFRKLEGDFKRTEEMHGRKIISNQDFEAKRYDLRQAEIAWERAKLALSHTAVKSPIAGVVADRMVELGDRVAPSVKLCSVVNLNNLIVRVFVPGREVRSLAAGQPVMLTSDFLPGAKLRGQIKRISPVVDPSSGTFKVTVGVLGGDGALKPGMFVNAHIVTATHEDAVIVPKSAVVYDDGLPYVFVARDTVAERVRLDVGFADGEKMEVRAGVKRGDQIVVVGQNGLKDKARIRAIKGEGLLIPAKPDTAKKT